MALRSRALRLGMESLSMEVSPAIVLSTLGLIITVGLALIGAVWRLSNKIGAIDTLQREQMEAKRILDEVVRKQEFEQHKLEDDRKHAISDAKAGLQDVAQAKLETQYTFIQQRLDNIQTDLKKVLEK